MKIPEWVYSRITAIAKVVVGEGQRAINQRGVLRRFLVDIWLAERNDKGWVVCTQRDIRSLYHPLLSKCEINHQGKRQKVARLIDVLSDIAADFYFEEGFASQDVKKRKPSLWQFNPIRPKSDVGSLRLVDAATGQHFTFKQILRANGKAPKHTLNLGKRQAGLKSKEQVWLKGVTRGRMHRNFLRQLRTMVGGDYYRQGIRSINHLYNGKIEGDYVVYDHTYRLTFGGRYYDRAFQNLPNPLKSKFRHGLLNYDIRSCSLACINRLCKRYHVDHRVKSSIYEMMMKKTGLTRKQCKNMVHTTTYRIGRVTVGVASGLGERILAWVDTKKAAMKILRWWKAYVRPLRIALEELVTKIHQRHRETCNSPRNYHRIENDLGLVLDLKDEKYNRKKKHAQQYARDKNLLAFMICGVEQAYIREIVRLNLGAICMLDHDGVVALRELKLPDCLGFKLELKN
ncbi:hypothetical protein PGS49_03420 [Yersinia intermedia]|uniref:hypothetical protein n=1 Tax=Yersinia intermedia TaxID=631 RepID=UPI0022FF3C94|nr:hypothetical protein [Yersinia intermedia]MDA5479711.1 hypothetical protein [Yersinia intermedia]